MNNIPHSIRKIENLHILFWLLKDMSWCMEWRILGVLMIIPTVGLCVFTTVKMWSDLSERYHNIAVLLWILANSFWMLSEFLGVDGKIITQNISIKDLSIVPFGLGVLVLFWFYLVVKTKIAKANS
jgi:hypothetical protein